MSMPDIKFVAADALGIRLEYVAGLPIWEASPTYRHQREVDRIAQSLHHRDGTEPCACHGIRDVYFQFPGSLKRPDLAILCREPADAEIDGALTLVPEAVVEVVSKGYEAKDLEIGPPFYLNQGVKDVLVFDPATLLVLHVRKDGVKRLTSPVDVQLECGCGLRV